MSGPAEEWHADARPGESGVELIVWCRGVGAEPLTIPVSDPLALARRLLELHAEAQARRR